MNYQNIAEIYAENDKIRERLKETVSGLTDEQSMSMPEGEKWTIAQIVEHLSMVEDGMTRVSAKLLKAAESAGKKSDGKVQFSEDFARKIGIMRKRKFEAPERVRPSGNQTIQESLAKMEENRRKLYELKPIFEQFECTDFKFPHPLMGELTATEWLTLIGEHEARHLEQIKRMLN